MMKRDEERWRMIADAKVEVVMLAIGVVSGKVA